MGTLLWSFSIGQIVFGQDKKLERITPATTTG
jgi:hypothetical protein